jgi:hypothetical protein
MYWLQTWLEPTTIQDICWETSGLLGCLKSHLISRPQKVTVPCTLGPMDCDCWPIKQTLRGTLTNWSISRGRRWGTWKLCSRKKGWRRTCKLVACRHIQPQTSCAQQSQWLQAFWLGCLWAKSVLSPDWQTLCFLQFTGICYLLPLWEFIIWQPWEGIKMYMQVAEN